MSFASPNLQEIAQERYGAPKVWHVSTAGNDSTGDGLSWGTAYATVFKAASVATAGHLILCGAGTIDEGANTVTLPDGVSLRGAGKYATTLTNSRTDGFVLLPGNNSRVGDLTILSTPGGSNFTFPVGCNVASDGSGAKAGVAMERVAVVGHTDGLYFQDFGSVSAPVSIGWTLTDCDVTTDYDAVAVLLTKNVTGTVDLFRCRISTNGSAVGTARSVNNESAVTVRLYDCDLSATGGVGGGSNNACVYAQGQTGSNAFTAKVELRGCRLNAVPASGAAYDANANPQASILAVDCSGSGTDGLLLTTGTVAVTGRDRVAAVKAQTAAAAQQANALAALAATQTNVAAAGSAAAGLAAAATQATAANAKLILSGNNRLLAVPQDDPSGVVIPPLPVGTLLAVVGGNGAYNLTQDGGVGAGGAAITLNGVALTTDSLRVLDANNAAVANAAVQLFLASDTTYNAYVGTTLTGVDGRWVGPIKANSGSYTLLVSAEGEQVDVVTGLVVP